MSALADTRRDRVTAAGLAIGGIFGMAGTFVERAHLRQLFWMLDGVGIVVAAALLAVKFFRKGNDTLAASFLVFLAAEALVLSGTAAGLEVSRASFASGIALWAASLVMTSLTTVFPRWSRVTGLVAAALFTLTAVKIACGDTIVATSAPLPSAGFPFLVLTFVGWIRILLGTGGQGIQGPNSDRVKQPMEPLPSTARAPRPAPDAGAIPRHGGAPDLLRGR
jgi:hypothetical protein